MIFLAIVACYRLGLQYSPTVTLAIWGALMAIACSIGTLLLWTSTTGEVTWHNRVAGMLIPWGSRLNQGKLWPIPVVSWLVWMAVGAATCMLFHPSAIEPNAPLALTRTLLLLAWIVDGSGLMYVLGTMSQSFSIATTGGRNMLKVAGVIAAILIGSVVAYLSGASTLALELAGGPPLLLGTFFGIYMGIILFAGRNARWN